MGEYGPCISVRWPESDSIGMSNIHAFVSFFSIFRLPLHNVPSKNYYRLCPKAT